ncbi:Tigger transposable element-derived protein 1 [Plecturocebus cupreus]
MSENAENCTQYGNGDKIEKLEDDFEESKTSVEKVAADVVKIAREVELEIDPEDKSLRTSAAHEKEHDFGIRQTCILLYISFAAQDKERSRIKEKKGRKRKRERKLLIIHLLKPNSDDSSHLFSIKSCSVTDGELASSVGEPF